MRAQPFLCASVAVDGLRTHKTLRTTHKHHKKPTKRAIVNTLLAKVHIKKKAGFKPTEKTTGGGGAAGGPGGAPDFPAAVMARLTSLTRRVNGAILPQLYDGTQSSVVMAGGW